MCKGVKIFSIFKEVIIAKQLHMSSKYDNSNI